MGWDIKVFRLDFDGLRRIQGSNDERLLEQIASAYALDEEDSLAAADEEDEEDEPRLPVKQALRNIVFNTIADDQPDPSIQMPSDSSIRPSALSTLATCGSRR
jgi:hypothetical protein